MISCSGKIMVISSFTGSGSGGTGLRSSCSAELLPSPQASNSRNSAWITSDPTMPVWKCLSCVTVKTRPLCPEPGQDANAESTPRTIQRC